MDVRARYGINLKIVDCWNLQHAISHLCIQIFHKIIPPHSKTQRDIENRSSINRLIDLSEIVPLSLQTRMFRLLIFVAWNRSMGNIQNRYMRIIDDDEHGKLWNRIPFITRLSSHTSSIIMRLFSIDSNKKRTNIRTYSWDKCFWALSSNHKTHKITMIDVKWVSKCE